VAQETLRIGKLAKLLGTTTKTLRFYEDIGLLGPAMRSDAGYRLYDVKATSHIRLILHLRKLGFTINNLKKIFVKDKKQSFRQQVLSLMDEKLRDTDEELVILQGRREDLAARHQALLLTPKNRPSECICDALLSPCTCIVDSSTK